MAEAIGTLVLSTLAGVSLAAAALAQMAPRRRLGVAIVGVLLDWLPFGLGWMTVAGSPAPWLFRAHLGFGAAGYALLATCGVNWIRGIERPRPIRVAYLALWTVGYLAGVAMVLGIGR